MEDVHAVGAFLVGTLAGFGVGGLTFYAIVHLLGVWIGLAVWALAALMIADYTVEPSFLGIRYTTGGVWTHLGEFLYGLVLGVPFLLGGAIGVYRGAARISATGAAEKSVD